LGDALGEALSLAYAIDDAYFGDIQREVSGSANGVPYKLKYRPSTDIDGNYGINIEYGLMAGLDPNRALVFALQARGDKLISRNFTRRNLPITMNAAEEERAIDMEEMRDALKAGVASLAAAVPQMVTQGQNPLEIIEKMATVIGERKKGTPLEDAVARAFEQPEEEEQEQDPMQPAMQPGMQPGGDMPAMEQGPPPMQQLLAGLTGSGNPVLAGRVVRQVPA